MEDNIMEDNIIECTKSDFAEHTIILRGKPLSYIDHLIQKEVMNSEAREILYYGGRQIGKSSFLSIDMITDSVLTDWLSTLYIAPSILQVKEFSDQKLKMTIELG